MGDSPGTKRVIINADDFGFSRGITEGILEAHRRGIVTSTTIAANMPTADEAVRRLAEAPQLGVGVHLNVSQGPPLSPEARVLADADGVMRLTGAQAVGLCVRKPRMLRVIEAEYDAQIRWVLDRGVAPTHLDSHRHTHGFPPVFARVAGLARRYNIRFIRWHREVLPGAGWPAGPPAQRRIRRLLNAFGWIDARIAPDLVATLGTWGIEHTGSIDVPWLVRAACAIQPGVTEIMTHPGLADDVDEETSRLRASRRRELTALCDRTVAEALKVWGIERVHYGQI
jgi:predicted glycoside hydrolase/deacetylase ChbG (UPF0249 family)